MYTKEHLHYKAPGPRGTANTAVYSTLPLFLRGPCHYAVHPGTELNAK